MAKSNGFIRAMDSLPMWAKLILAIPALDIIWGIYRIVKGISTNSPIMMIFGILWIIPGAVICWLLDIITIIISKRPTIFA